MTDANVAALRVVKNHGRKRGPKPADGKAGHIPKSFSGAIPEKSEYRPLPPVPPKWANLDDRGKECYKRIRGEQSRWHKGRDTRAFVGEGDLESLIVVCQLYEEIHRTREVVDMMIESGTANASAVEKVRRAIVDYKRHHAMLGYEYGCNMNYIDADGTPDEDADDFS